MEVLNEVSQWAAILLAFLLLSVHMAKRRGKGGHW